MKIHIRRPRNEPQRSLCGLGVVPWSPHVTTLTDAREKLRRHALDDAYCGTCVRMIKGMDHEAFVNDASTMINDYLCETFEKHEGRCWSKHNVGHDGPGTYEVSLHGSRTCIDCNDWFYDNTWEQVNGAVGHYDDYVEKALAILIEHDIDREHLQFRTLKDKKTALVCYKPSGDVATYVGGDNPNINLAEALLSLKKLLLKDGKKERPKLESPSSKKLREVYQHLREGSENLRQQAHIRSVKIQSFQTPDKEREVLRRERVILEQGIAHFNQLLSLFEDND